MVEQTYEMEQMGIKLCPFCGGEVIPPDEDDLVYFINHDDSCFLKHEKTFTEYGIEAWNRREPMDKIVEQLEEIQIGEYSAKAEYVQGMNGISAAYCDGAISTIEKAIEIVKGGNDG